MNSLILNLFMLVLAKVIYSRECAFEDVQYYNVMVHQPVVFTCTHEGTIDIEEHPLQLARIDIVKDSIPVDNRFTYMNTTVNGTLVHKITLKNATLDLHYRSYNCFKSDKYCCSSRLRIMSRQKEPSCITNHYTKTPSEPTRFECAVLYAYPAINLKTIIPLGIETSYSALEEYDVLSHSYGDNDTHIVRKVEISGNVDNIDIFDCEATQYYPLSGERFDRKVCYFGSPPPTTTTTTTQPTTTQLTTTTTQLTTTTTQLTTTTILDNIANSNESNNGISICGSVILILVCLLIH